MAAHSRGTNDRKHMSVAQHTAYTATSWKAYSRATSERLLFCMCLNSLGFLTHVKVSMCKCTVGVFWYHFGVNSLKRDGTECRRPMLQLSTCLFFSILCARTPLSGQFILCCSDLGPDCPAVSKRGASLCLSRKTHQASFILSLVVLLVPDCFWRTILTLVAELRNDCDCVA